MELTINSFMAGITKILHCMALKTMSVQRCIHFECQTISFFTMNISEESIRSSQRTSPSKTLRAYTQTNWGTWIPFPLVTLCFSLRSSIFHLSFIDVIERSIIWHDFHLAPCRVKWPVTWLEVACYFGISRRRILGLVFFRSRSLLFEVFWLKILMGFKYSGFEVLWGWELVNFTCLCMRSMPSMISLCSSKSISPNNMIYDIKMIREGNSCTYSHFRMDNCFASNCCSLLSKMEFEQNCHDL